MPFDVPPYNLDGTLPAESARHDPQVYELPPDRWNVGCPCGFSVRNLRRWNDAQAVYLRHEEWARHKRPDGSQDAR